MKFCWATLPVKNLNDAIDFYHGVLGLPVCSRHSGHGVEMVMLGEENEPKIELICTQAGQKDNTSSSISIGIAVPSIEEAVTLLKKHHIPVENEPVSPAPNVRFLFITDPDGYTVQLVEMQG